MASGWASINILELQNKNSTLAMGPITQQETSIVISILNIGGFFGNFVILPLSRLIGIKRTIHILSIPLIVWLCNITQNKKKWILMMKFKFSLNWILAGNITRHSGWTCLLFVCCEIPYWNCRRFVFKY